MEELKPCPFCGSEPERHENTTGVWFSCENYECAYNAVINKEKAAIELWNTRATDPDTVTIKRSELEELKRLANNVCLQRLTGTIIDEGSSIFELSSFLKESALGKGE